MAVGRVAWQLAARQLGTEPFRTYLLARTATLVGAGLGGAAMVGALRPALGSVDDSRLYGPAVAAAIALVTAAFLCLRLLAHRWLNVGSVGAVARRDVLGAVGDLVFARGLPRTFLAVFLFVVVVPWALAVPGGGLWLEGVPWTGLAALMAGTSLVGWWCLGEDSEAAAGALLWPRPERPVRFFQRRYRPSGRRGWRRTERLLELSPSERRALFGPAAGGDVGFRRRLVGHVLAEVTARLAGAVPTDRVAAAAREPLPALGGGSVLALARRAADPRDPLTAADLYVRVGALPARAVAVGARSGPDRPPRQPGTGTAPGRR